MINEQSFRERERERESKVVAILLISAVLIMSQGGFWLNLEPPKADASAVTVSATVTQTVTCTTALTSTAFGTLTSSAVSTSTPNATTSVATNDGNGMTLSVLDANAGLATSSPAYTIPSPAIGNPATATLAAGTEGYGIQATSSNSSIIVAARYNLSGNTVGGLTTANQVLASSTAAISSSIVTVTHLAAISATTQAAAYADTITYSCLGK